MRNHIMQLFYNLILHNNLASSFERGSMKAPTMTDVAQLAGVSHATVSRVVNGRAGVNSETEALVRKAMADLQYLAPPTENRPGKSARRSKSDAIRHIALLTFDRALTEHSTFVASIYEGARRAASEQGIAVSLLSLDDIDTVPDWIHPDNIDGLLLHGLRSRAYLARTADKIPSLWLTTHEDRGVNAVLPGNRQVGKLAAEWLLERGHERVTTLSIDPGNASYEVRTESFQDSVRQQGARFVSCRLTASEHTREAHPEARMQFLVRKWKTKEKSERPTGIFSPSDYMTALAYAAFRRESVRPGKDLEIVSCDNEEAYLTGLFPRPTTIDLGTEERGRMAFELLLARIRDPGLDRRAALILEPELVLSPDLS